MLESLFDDPSLMGEFIDDSVILHDVEDDDDEG